MKLHRLHAEYFAGIREVDVEFGPGLNVLFGPNDLGKSTLVEAIRVALLLPHSSTYCDQFVGWSGEHQPIVEMTFETEPQRIWRVRKTFGKGGSALLQESKNGRDFDEVERSRKVDAKLRELLRWGIPEPGGAGGAKGLPTSFLATALLSTQADVSAMLNESLQGDSTASGRERIAAALQAVAQDPLFVAVLRRTQERRDEAYTDKGTRKTARGSVFRAAAERLIEARDEKERLQKAVADSEGAEHQLRDLMNRRTRQQESLADLSDRITNLQRTATLSAERAAAAEQLRRTEAEVVRIQDIGKAVAAAERRIEELLAAKEAAKQELLIAERQQVEAGTEFQTAEKAARNEETAPGVADTVMRQQLELRKAAAEQAAAKAQQLITAALNAQELVAAAAEAERSHRSLLAHAEIAGQLSSVAAAKQKSAEDKLRHCDVLEKALDVRTATKRVEDAQAAVDTDGVLRKRLEDALAEQTSLAANRAAVKVPDSESLRPMRRLAADLAAARGALDVGLVATVTPAGKVDLRIRRDDAASEKKSKVQKPFEIEADSEVEISLPDIVTIRVRGGRRETQKKVELLEDRWNRDVVPHLAAAGVADLDALDAKILEARELDSRLKSAQAELEALRSRIASLAGASEELRLASEHAAACAARLEGVALETFEHSLAALGPDAAAVLRNQKQGVVKEAKGALIEANEAANAHALALERTKYSQVTLNSAVSERDAALRAFPHGAVKALAISQSELAASMLEVERATAEFTSLQSALAARKERIEAAVAGARRKAENMRALVEAAQLKLTASITEHASQTGRLGELRRQRDAEDLPAAEAVRQEAMQRYAALPVPERNVANDEISEARIAQDRMRSDLLAIERDIQRTHGALEHVGGAVARERLRDATEAFDLAERQEREIEADYESWKLLLEQMKEADAAQASNLGQTLVPAIAARFQSLTRQRYESLQLTAQLGTEGIVVGGTARSPARISVGTREQLSTLYRLSLAEYLQTVVVLDDQLVQSDCSRMDWFRTLLNEKSRYFQIVVFTCRPGDYLTASSMPPEGNTVHADSDDSFVRAIDLGRAIRRQ